MLANAEADLRIRCSNMSLGASESNGIWAVSRDVVFRCVCTARSKSFPLKIISLVGYKNDLMKYFMQHVRNCLIIQLTNSLKNNIC